MLKKIVQQKTGLWAPIAALCLTFGAGEVSAERVVTLANGEWSPYQGEQLEGNGPASMVVREAFESQGWTVEFEFLPWARGLADSKSVRNDGTFIYSFNEERGADFFYSNPVIELETVAFYRNDNPIQWSSEDDLKGLKLGAVIAYDYGFITEEAGYQLDRTPEPEANFRKLAAGRVDVVLEEAFVGLELAEQAGVADQVSFNPRPIKAVPYHLIVSRTHPDAEEIISTFNAGLVELSSSGRLAELLK